MQRVVFEQPPALNRPPTDISEVMAMPVRVGAQDKPLSSWTADDMRTYVKEERARIAEQFVRKGGFN